MMIQLLHFSLRTLNYGNYGCMGNARFISSTVFFTRVFHIWDRSAGPHRAQKAETAFDHAANATKNSLNT